SLVALLALTLTAAPSHADVRVDSDTKLEYDVPSGWTTNAQGNAAILQDAKQETVITLVKTTEKDAPGVLNGIDKLFNSTMKDIKLDGNITEGSTNGLRSKQQRMTAKYGDKPWKGLIRVLETPEHKYVVIIIALAVEAKYEELKGPINVFLTSIKPHK